MSKKKCLRLEDLSPLYEELKAKESEEENNPNHLCGIFIFRHGVPILIWDSTRPLFSILYDSDHFTKPLDITQPSKILPIFQTAFLRLQILEVFTQVLIAMLICIAVKQIQAFIVRILYSFNQTLIEWLDNKFSSMLPSILPDWQNDLKSKHFELCQRYPNSKILVNLYLSGNIISQFWGILRVLREQNTEYLLDIYNLKPFYNQSATFFFT